MFRRDITCQKVQAPTQCFTSLLIIDTKVLSQLIIYKERIQTFISLLEDINIETSYSLL